jgi:hypothetical protein
MRKWALPPVPTLKGEKVVVGDLGLGGRRINFVVTDATVRDLPRAAEFAFERGAEELLLLPETSRGEVAVSQETLQQLSDWVRHSHGRCRLATSAHAAAIMDAPILPISDPAHASHDFMHVDAVGMLKVSAFTSAGERISDHPSILAAVQALRAPPRRSTTNPSLMEVTE